MASDEQQARGHRQDFSKQGCSSNAWHTPVKDDDEQQIKNNVGAG